MNTQEISIQLIVEIISPYMQTIVDNFDTILDEREQWSMTVCSSNRIGCEIGSAFMATSLGNLVNNFKLGDLVGNNPETPPFGRLEQKWFWPNCQW